MSLNKLRYSQTSGLYRDNQIRIDVKRYFWRDIARGNHQLAFVSTVNKRGKIVQDSSTQSFPMTLYYDTDTK